MVVFLVVVVAWASARMMWHYSPLSNYPGKIEMEAFFNLRIRLQDRAYWWVPLHFLSSVAIIGYIIVFVVRGLEITRHNLNIALLGVLWCAVMLLNINHAVAMPPVKAMFVNGGMTSVVFIISVLLAIFPKKILAVSIALFIAVGDRIPGIWLILVTKYTDMTAHIQVDLEKFFNP